MAGTPPTMTARAPGGPAAGGAQEKGGSMGDLNRRTAARKRELVRQIEQVSRQLARATATRDAIVAARDALLTELDEPVTDRAGREIGPVAWRQPPTVPEASPTPLRWRSWWPRNRH